MMRGRWDCSATRDCVAMQSRWECIAVPSRCEWVVAQGRWPGGLKYVATQAALQCVEGAELI